MSPNPSPYLGELKDSTRVPETAPNISKIKMIFTFISKNPVTPLEMNRLNTV